TNLHAALGVAQLEQLDAFVERKRATARAYSRALEALKGVTPLEEAPWAVSSYWMYSVLLDDSWGDVRALIRRGNADGIQLRPLWRPLHTQPAFAGCRADRIDVATRLYDRGVSLPRSRPCGTPHDPPRSPLPAPLAAARCRRPEPRLVARAVGVLPRDDDPGIL